MDGQDVKETMEQIHISEKMQEEIIMNVNNQMKNGKKRVWSLKKMGTVAAALVLTLGVISIPVSAMVSNFVKARMESIPIEEVQEINDMVQSKPTEADGFSREFSDSEEERKKELWQEYENGRFPENVLAEVDNAENVPEGTLCYIRSTGVFNLPDQEMTDEEILEIIDFQHKMSYAVEQSPAAQEARAEMEAEKNRLREKIQAAGGISEEEAIEIARKQMEAELGEGAEGKEILKYQDGSAAVLMEEISEETDYAHKGDVIYRVIFTDPNANEHSTYYCVVDAVGGSVLETYQ